MARNYLEALSELLTNGKKAGLVTDTQILEAREALLALQKSNTKALEMVTTAAGELTPAPSSIAPANP